MASPIAVELTGHDQDGPGTSEDISTDQICTAVETTEVTEEEAARRERRAGCASKADKKAAKKRQLQESWAKKKEAKKAAHKEAKTARTAEWEALPADEQEAIKNAAREKRLLREKAAAAEAGRAEPTASRPMPACVIDLDFDQLMDERGITSLAQQACANLLLHLRCPSFPFPITPTHPPTHPCRSCSRTAPTSAPPIPSATSSPRLRSRRRPSARMPPPIPHSLASLQRPAKAHRLCQPRCPTSPRRPAMPRLPFLRV
jgi:hypothetical protein